MEPIRDKEIFKQFERYYWNYYLDLENDFLTTKKYVDFSEGNFSAYSLEFLKLYQAVCSEIDVIGKMMAMYVDEEFDVEKSKGIGDWWSLVNSSYLLSEGWYTSMNPKPIPDRFYITDYKCLLLDWLQLQPWKEMKIEDGKVETPEWWKNYNKVKHRRYLLGAESSEPFYAKANFQNVSNAFAGLYILEKAFMDSVGTQNDLEAFANSSLLFVKRTFATSEEMDEMINKKQ